MCVRACMDVCMRVRWNTPHARCRYRHTDSELFSHYYDLFELSINILSSSFVLSNVILAVDIRTLGMILYIL